MKNMQLHRTALLAGTIAVVLAALPAVAQTTTASTAEPAAAGDPDAAIVVTGLRASLQSASQLKRNSESILDAIVAQDIGKLPDNQAIEALARLPGVQVTRSDDEANGILVRGLPNVMTTFNGRELFTVENRRANLQDFPAGALAGIEVYKSATADLVDPGLAGLINVRTRRPFDFKGLELAGSIRGAWNEQTRKIDPTYNLMLSDRWTTGIGEIGLLVNYSLVQTRYRNAVRFINSDVTTIDRGNTDPADDVVVTTPGVGGNVHVPNEIGLYYSRGKRVRPSVNSAFQWRPAENFEMYVEGLWQGYRGESANDRFGSNLVDRSDEGLRATFSNVVLDPKDPTRITRLSKSGGKPGETYRSTTNDQGDTYQAATGFKWNTGRAEITGEGAWTKSVYTWKTYSLDGQTRTSPTLDVDFDRNNGVSFALPGFAALEPANWNWRGFYDSRGRSEGAGTQWRLDVKLDTDWAVVKRLDFGMRATTHTARTRSGDRYAWTAPLGIPLASLPVGPLEVVSDGFRGNDQPFRNWLTPSRNGIRDNYEKLRLASYEAMKKLDWASDVANWSTPEAQIPPRSGFDASENSYAAYAQSRFDLEPAGAPIDGTLGIRIVNTDGQYSGTFQQTDANGVMTLVPLTTRQNYVNVLPTFQARWKITPKLQLRVGATRTFTRPSFGDLNPTRTISIVNPTRNPNETRAAFVNSGNPDLKPLTSDNYDVSLEYYFGNAGSASAAVFRRDVEGFINTYTRDIQYGNYGLVSLTQPENAGKGKIQGVEVAGQTFFDFLPGWLSGFGVQANLTYLDAQNALPRALGTGAPMVRMTGVSKWTYNLAGFYEKGPLAVRLSYNRRSGWVNSYSRNSNESQYAGELARPVSRLDFSTSYEWNKNVTLTFEMSNILAQPYENYRYYSQTAFYSRDVRDEGRFMSLGARFKF